MRQFNLFGWIVVFFYAFQQEVERKYGEDVEGGEEVNFAS